MKKTKSPSAAGSCPPDEMLVATDERSRSDRLLDCAGRLVAETQTPAVTEMKGNRDALWFWAVHGAQETPRVHEDDE